MSSEQNKNAITTSPTAGFERRDLSPAGVLYFMLGLAVVTALLALLLTGFYKLLDKREAARQPEVNPLVTSVPTDTRRVTREAPQSFPEPRLEEDERGQINASRIKEEQTLNSYGWVDEKAGVVRIPIERAMDLVAERGLPVHPPESGGPAAVVKKGSKQ